MALQIKSKLFQLYYNTGIALVAEIRLETLTALSSEGHAAHGTRTLAASLSIVRFFLLHYR